MSNGYLTLPVNIPWRLIATSEDMMHDRGTNPLPDPWRSSISIYAHEPRIEDTDPELCAQRLTFLKVSCSVTGIQHDEIEAEAIRNYNDKDQKEEQLSRLEEIASEYFACYGLLLNVSVFPGGKGSEEASLEDYPHIIDYEPKRRDLYQTATETGEILTASRSEARTDKSLTSTDSTETGVSSGVEAPLGESGGTATIGSTHKWGSVDQDVQATSSDASRERHETVGTTTTLSQMYNLLTAYHAGTNRAVFFVQPRPHTLQPTEKRTFVNGLREIEGQQDFLLIVARPVDMPGLCIQARLETGHFGETAGTVAIEGSVEKKPQEIPIYESVKAGIGQEKKKIINFVSAPLEIDGWEFDPEEQHGGHGYVEQKINSGDSAAAIENHEGSLSYRTEDGRFVLSWTIIAHGPYVPFVENITSFDRTYTVHLRRTTSDGPSFQTDPDKLIVSSRTLDVCVRSDDETGCLHALPVPGRPDGTALPKPNRPDLTEYDFYWRGQAAGPGIDPRPFYRKMQSRIARATNALTPGEFSLLDTDYVAKRMVSAISPTTLSEAAVAREADSVSELPNMTREDMLKSPARELGRRLGVSRADVAALRRQVMAIAPKAPPTSRS